MVNNGYKIPIINGYNDYNNGKLWLYNGYNNGNNNGYNDYNIPIFTRKYTRPGKLSQFANWKDNHHF